MTRITFGALLVMGWAIALPARGQSEDTPAVPVAPVPEATGVATAPPPDSAVTVNEAGLFDLHLRQTSLADALRLLSRRAQRNISVTQRVDASVSADLYQVSFEEALEALVTPAGFTWCTRGKFIYVCHPEERDAVLMANRAVELRMYELNFVTAGTATPLIRELLSPVGRIVSTAESPVPGMAMTPDDFDAAMNNGLGGKSRAVGEFIVVRDYPEVLDDVGEILARLDVRPRQALVEAVILRARLDESNALGVDFNGLAGIDFRTIDATSVGGTNLTPGNVPQRKFDKEVGAVGSSLSANIAPGGFSLGVISNNAAVFVRALEDIVDLTIVANPKVLTVNEQPGRVIVGREDGYLTSTVTETATVQEVEFLETGTQILFRPFITNDGYVRMDIHPEDSSGGLTPDNLPFKDTTELTTNVVIKDGHTLVIGGLFREVTTSNNTQLPWLGDLPVVGALFRGKIDTAVREEVIVLITPHIIDSEDALAASEWARDEVERRRVLAHRGLMPWGRERLAQAHYGWALEHYRAGAEDKAVWDLDLALSLNPRFIEASRLRDQMTSEKTQEPDNSVIHTLLRDMALGTVPPPLPETPLTPEVEMPAVEPADTEAGE